MPVHTRACSAGRKCGCQGASWAPGTRRDQLQAGPAPGGTSTRLGNSTGGGAGGDQLQAGLGHVTKMQVSTWSQPGEPHVVGQNSKRENGQRPPRRGDRRRKGPRPRRADPRSAAGAGSTRSPSGRTGTSLGKHSESSTATTPGGGDRDVFLDTYFEFKKFSTRMHCFVIEPIFESVASFLIEMHYNSHKYLY